MVELQVHDGVRPGRQRLAKLTLPGLPRVLAPEIINTEKSPFLYVVAERGGFVLVEISPTRLGHHYEGAAKQLRLRESDQDVVGRTGLLQAYRGLRQFREADRKVFVGSWKVHAP